MSIQFAQAITKHFDQVHVAIVVEIDAKRTVEFCFEHRSAGNFVPASGHKDQFGSEGTGLFALALSNSAFAGNFVPASGHKDQFGSEGTV